MARPLAPEGEPDRRRRFEADADNDAAVEQAVPSTNSGRGHEITISEDRLTESDPGDELTDFELAQLDKPEAETRLSRREAARERMRFKYSTIKLVMLVTLVTLLALVAVAALFGGFRFRTFQAETVDHGTVMELGPIALTQEIAIAKSSDPKELPPEQRAWELETKGTCANRQTEENGVGMGILFHPETVVYVFHETADEDIMVAHADQFVIDPEIDGSGREERQTIAPNTAPRPCTFKFEMPLGYAPQDTIHLRIYTLEYAATGNVRVDHAEKSWERSNRSFYSVLPVEAVDLAPEPF